MTTARKFDAVEHAVYDNRAGQKMAGYQSVRIRAGYRGSERIVPPAGERYAFDVERWAREVSVVVSPTGRSVRVFVDGVEVPAPARAEAS